MTDRDRPNTKDGVFPWGNGAQEQHDSRGNACTRWQPWNTVTVVGPRYASHGDRSGGFVEVFTLAFGRIFFSSFPPKSTPKPWIHTKPSPESDLAPSKNREGGLTPPIALRLDVRWGQLRSPTDANVAQATASRPNQGPSAATDSPPEMSTWRFSAWLWEVVATGTRS